MNSSAYAIRSLTLLSAFSFRVLLVLALPLSLHPQTGPPAVTVDPASQIGGASAVVTGTVNPNGLTTVWHVSYGTTTAYGYTTVFGTLPAQDAAISVTTNLAPLSPRTTYHYQLVATNSAGHTASPDMSFTTGGLQTPFVYLAGPLQITPFSASVSGWVEPNGLVTSVYVRWDTNSGSFGHTSPIQSLPWPNAGAVVIAMMDDLIPSTTYHFQLVASNSDGSSYSPVMTLTTLPPPPGPPIVVTGPASSITATTAALSGTVNPNADLANYTFQWGTNTAYGNTKGFGTSSLFGTTPQTVSATLTGLTPATTYHYQLLATNSAGNSAGADQTFTTLNGFVVGGHVLTYITNNGTITILGYTGPGGSVTVPSAINGLPVTTIANKAFYEIFTLTNITIPDTVTVIGDSAFESSGLTSFTIPDSVTQLGQFAFNFCGALSSVALGSGLTYIPPFAFAYDGLTSLNIPNNIGAIGLSACEFNSSLTNLILSDGLTDIGASAFANCSKLTSLSVPANVTNIDADAFSSCFSLSNLAIGASVRSIAAGAFANCIGLTRVTLPDSVTNLSDGSGGWSGPVGAFAFCAALTNVIIGKGLAYLGDGTFTSCANLVSIYFQGNAPPFGSYSSPYPTTPFFNATNAVVYYLPGTTGWTSTYAGQPALLWNPHPVTDDASFGLRQNPFGFNITGTADIPLVIEAAINLAAGPWLPLQSCTLTNGLIHFTDPNSTQYGGRFYRIRSP